MIQFIFTVINLLLQGKQKGKKLQALQDVKEADLGAYKGGSYTSPTGKSVTLNYCMLSQLKVSYVCIKM